MDGNQEMNASRVSELVARFEGRRVAVLGDLMLDRYIWGKASRLSQEAPVPVVRVQRSTVAPGGAANVLRNLAAFGARGIAFGVVGGDLAGQLLRDQLTALAIDTSYVVDDRDRATTEKTRLIAGNQQVVRIDTEDALALSARQIDALAASLRERASANGLDAIIVEDYAKGVVTKDLLARVVEIGAAYDLPVALDPHPSNPMNTQGLALMTPNRAEAFALAGLYYRETVAPIEQDIALLEVVDRLESLWDPRYLMVTLGADGVALFHKDAPPLYVPTRAKEVFDVSGAGDTVIATFTLALVSGASPIEACVLSNHAGGIEVGKVGTAPVYPGELIASFETEDA